MASKKVASERFVKSIEAAVVEQKHIFDEENALISFVSKILFEISSIVDFLGISDALLYLIAYGILSTCSSASLWNEDNILESSNVRWYGGLFSSSAGTQCLAMLM